MRIRLVVIGTKMPAWVQSGYQQYVRRMPREIALELIEIPLAHRGKNADLIRLVKKEGEAMMALIKPTDFVVALDVKGKSWTTGELAKQLLNWQMLGSDVCLLVGGPDGLAADCIDRAGQLWSLSDLTFPHPMIRILVAESLYRAWTVNTGHPYHRE